MSLTYVGDGAFIAGIPTTDLTAADLAAIAEQRGVPVAVLTKALVGSGLYKSKPEPKAPAPAEK